MTRIQELRDSLLHGVSATQSQLDAVAIELHSQKALLRPKDKEEPLPLFDAQGNPIGTNAPRWICHLLGLRHRCAHVLLIWRSRAMGDTLVLQIRSWDKDDSPGHLDISVGGHMTATDKRTEDTAFTELLQETNLTINDLEDRKLRSVGGYSFDEPPRPAENFFNSEWRDVYVGYVNDESFKKIKFPDGEVAGVVLLPLKDARRLLGQRTIPMASALKQSLPVCLAKMLNG